MEFFLELLLEIFGEALLQFIFEALAEVGLRVFHKASQREPVRPWLAAVGYLLLGAACGGLSLWLFPSFFVQSPTGRAASFVITPVLAGAGMALIGAWRRRRGEQVIRLDRFAYGYAFALAMAAVRFHFGQVG
ncbi:MAG TPA: hypothetical protein VFL86_05760 [Burkholderiaceae bacterium]|nr:hypothetical protein [Burkholderiaceae bacterium]